MINFTLGYIWESLRSSLWFLPTLLVLAAILLALTLVTIDTQIDSKDLRTNWPNVFGAGAEGSRGMLSAIATSMITIAGVAFSITIVALSLASSQYTSRILRNFMRDRTNQTVLGTLVGIYVYCLIVLRTIRSADEGGFVPSLAVLFAVVLALLGIGCFIYFIHHIALSIQAESIIKSAAEETVDAIDRLFPAEIGDSPHENDGISGNGETSVQRWYPVHAKQTGFLQAIDSDRVLGLSKELGTVIRLEHTIGNFVVEGSVLVSLADIREISSDSETALTDLFAIGRQRTTVQDAGFGIRQIVDIAVKALSSGVNDTTTAVTCIHYLSALMTRLAQRKFESSYRYHEGELRVIAQGATFSGLLHEAFDQIRQNSVGNVGTLLALLRATEVIGAQTRDPQRREALSRQAEAIASTARAGNYAPMDRETLETAIGRLSLALAQQVIE